MSPQSISGQTRIIGIFGDPIAHTRSPIMQNAAFRARNLAYVYVPFLVKSVDLSHAVQSIRTLNLAGVNVTVPHKERIVRYLDALSDEAKLCRAVNTIVNRQGRLFGENTDGRGFLRSLKERDVALHHREVMLIGAGGSARSILASLVYANCARITIVNRTQTHAQALVRSYHSLGKTKLESLPLAALQEPSLLKNKSLIVNCTSVGLHSPKFFPLAYSSTPRSCLFYDLLYRSELTPFLQEARRARRPVLDGRHMLLHQGALAFSLWTGIPAPLEEMKRALSQTLRC